METSDRNELSKQAQGRVFGWAYAAQALALLTAVHEHGWTTFLSHPRTLPELAAFTGLPPARLGAVLDVLDASAVIRRTGELFELRPEFAELLTEDGIYALDDLLGRTAAMTRLVRDSADAAAPAQATDEESLALARGFVFRPGPGGREVYGRMLEAVPEFASALRTGRVLDVGCGVAGAMLTAASMFPGLTGIGLEVVPSVAAEAQRRAKESGGRFDVLAMDAREFPETEAFDACFWAQPFFPEETRAETLQMIRRALKPGGILIMQEMEVEPAEQDDRVPFALRRLVFGGWRVPFARTAEDLAAEAAGAGFETVRIAMTVLGRIVILR